MKNQNTGFTLIEVAMVMVIIGLILAASITPLSNQIERSKIQQTNSILNDVMEALYGFAAANGRLPCPTNATNAGQEAINAGNCLLLNGFVPGRTLNLSGEYNPDTLLLDAWGNPIRYAVTQSDQNANGEFDFTFSPVANPSNMQTVTTAALVPDLVICSFESGAPDANNNCTGGGITLSNRAVAVVLSLGKDGNEATSVGAVNGGDQQENSGEVLLAAGPSGYSFWVGNDTVFVSHEYKMTTTNSADGHGAYNDQIIWMSPFTLYDRMYRSGALP